MTSLSNNCLIILAAGIGSRYGQESAPKQFDAFLGKKKNKTILHFSLANLESFFDHYIFVIRKETESLFCALFHKFLNRHSHTIVYQSLESHCNTGSLDLCEKKPLGTAHAVMIALPHVPPEMKSFMIVNSDDYYGKDSISKLCSGILNHSIVMVGYFLKNTLSPSGGVNRGICTVNENGFLENINETK